MAEGFLIHADAVRSPDMYLATGAADTDPFSYIEVDGRRIVVTNVLEAPMLEGSPLLTDVWLDDDFDRRGLVAGGMASDQARYEVTRRALERAGVASALVPPDFPLALADYLRARGIEVRPARAEFELRRRCKDARALAGIRQAQRASEAAMRRCEELLTSSTPAATGLVVDGEPLTCERLIGEIEHTLATHGCEGEPPLVSAGPQVAFVHESGRGPIRPGEPVVIDIFPRDRASRFHADMTRTFCVGPAAEAIVRMHRVCYEAVQRSCERIAAGASGRAVWEAACDVVEAAGYRTLRSLGAGERLDEDFFHGLGHGVGLQVHEAPSLGLSGGELLAGDVVSVEPGLYRKDLGGVRIEDLVLVVEGGCEVLTDYHYRLEIEPERGR